VRFSATQFSDTFLPESRSEIVWALKSENKTIGVLDIHNEKEDAFHQADLSVMQIIAINSRLPSSAPDSRKNPVDIYPTSTKPTEKHPRRMEKIHHRPSTAKSRVSIR
jgi:hypothetical protein